MTVVDGDPDGGVAGKGQNGEAGGDSFEVTTCGLGGRFAPNTSLRPSSRFARLLSRAPRRSQVTASHFWFAQRTVERGSLGQDAIVLDSYRAWHASG